MIAEQIVALAPSGESETPELKATAWREGRMVGQPQWI